MLAPAAVAAVHVATERGGAACLDRGHDLEPSGAEPPGQAAPVSAAGAAEDLRHAGAFALHGGSAAEHREARDGVVEALEHLAGGAGVAAGRVGTAMPEHVSNHIHTAAAILPPRS